jgi:hypothetical protein
MSFNGTEGLADYSPVCPSNFVGKQTHIRGQHAQMTHKMTDMDQQLERPRRRLRRLPHYFSRLSAGPTSSMNRMSP